MGSHRGTTCRLLLILLISDAVMCDIQEFFANLPADVGNSFNNAWNNMLKAIKRPVRIRRLGQTGKTKTSAIPVTEPMVATSSKEQWTCTNTPLSTDKSAKLIIPILATPHWKSMLDWRRQRLGPDWINNELNPHRYVHERTSDARTAPKKKGIAQFGNLFFI